MSDCYLTITPDILKAMEFGNGLCVPKQDTDLSNKWSNVYFIKIDKQAWISKYGNKFIDIPSGTIKNNEVDRIEWFTENEVLNLTNLQSFIKSIFTNYPNLSTSLP